jgi:hypothetical protein
VNDRMREFGLLLEKNNEALLREIGYGPAPWASTVERHEAVDTAKHLLRTGDHVSTGLAELATADRLDQSIEWYVLVYADLFEPEERQVAYQRLSLHNVSIDQWLVERLSRHLP